MQVQYPVVFEEACESTHRLSGIFRIILRKWKATYNRVVEATYVSGNFRMYFAEQVASTFYTQRPRMTASLRMRAALVI